MTSAPTSIKSVYNYLFIYIFKKRKEERSYIRLFFGGIFSPVNLSRRKKSSGGLALFIWKRRQWLPDDDSAFFFFLLVSAFCSHSSILPA